MDAEGSSAHAEITVSAEADCSPVRRDPLGDALGRRSYDHGMSDQRGVGSSFFHLADVELDHQPCQGTACFVARHLDPARWEEASDATPRVYCLGKCFAAPATAADRGRPRVEVASPTSVVLERIARGDGSELTTYAEHGGHAALERSLDIGPEAIVAEVEASGCAAGAAPRTRLGAS